VSALRGIGAVQKKEGGKKNFPIAGAPSKGKYQIDRDEFTREDSRASIGRN